MVLEQNANIAAVAGVLPVILTSIFLALQIGQNSKALRSASIQAAITGAVPDFSIPRRGRRVSAFCLTS